MTKAEKDEIKFNARVEEALAEIRQRRIDNVLLAICDCEDRLESLRNEYEYLTCDDPSEWKKRQNAVEN